MALDDISLTSGMKANLLELENVTNLMNRTQTRLSTGKAVNSPIDNPLNYFIAQSLTNRAANISTAKDNMSLGLQTISAANNGITAITSLVAAAQGVANSALAASSSDTTTITALAKQYNGLLAQIDNAATNSAFQGVNLLTGNNLTVNLGDNSTLTVTGVSANSTGLSLSTAPTDGTWQSSTTTSVANSLSQLGTALTTLQTDSQSLSANSNIVTIRQTFADNMISTLSTGSDDLTLADMNQESANMLALQTQQQLGIAALGIAAQAAQSVLKLI